MAGTLNLMPLSVGPPIAASAVDLRRPARLYEVLRVKRSASAVEIKAAYRNLAKVYHPDSAGRRSESDERAFIEIHEAYETLSDPSARAVYDLSLGGGSGWLVAPNGSYHTRNWETDQCW